MRDRVWGRGERRRRGDDATFISMRRNARVESCASRAGQRRSRLCTRHVFPVSLFLPSLYLSRRMINSRAIVPYLEPQLFPRTLQRYRVEALFASIGQKRLIILSTTEFHGSRTMLLSSFPRSPFLNLCLLETRTTWTELEPRRYLFVFDFFRITSFRANKYSSLRVRIVILSCNNRLVSRPSKKRP